MDRQSAFSKKNLQTINIDKRDWMEELNLPPALAKFLREEARTIQIGLAIGLVLVLGYYGTTFYLHRHLEKGTGLLARAATIENLQDRKARLQEVVKKYGNSDAGLWARIDLAHQAYDAGQYEDAVTYFKQAIEKAGSGNSVVPLLEYGLANAYEQKKDLSDAKAFERQGYLGEARVQEEQGDLVAALQSYQRVLNLGEKDKGNGNDWLEEKVRSLKASLAASGKKAGSSE
jgi:predicted negative regulator of RcsB-dependent stress response